MIGLKTVIENVTCASHQKSELTAQIVTTLVPRLLTKLTDAIASGEVEKDTGVGGDLAGDALGACFSRFPNPKTGYPGALCDCSRSALLVTLLAYSRLLPIQHKGTATCVLWSTVGKPGTTTELPNPGYKSRSTPVHCPTRD